MVPGGIHRVITGTAERWATWSANTVKVHPTPAAFALNAHDDEVCTLLGGHPDEFISHIANDDH